VILLSSSNRCHERAAFLVKNPQNKDLTFQVKDSILLFVEDNDARLRQRDN